MFSAAQQKPLRPLSTSDLFKLEEVGQVALSPDGQWLAYVLKRSKSTARIHSRPFLEGNDRGDIWLVSSAGGRPRNLTNGLSNGSGWWAPLWSPDSRRLAILSTKGGNVRLWLWDKVSGRLDQITERGIDIAAAQQPPVAWLNSHQLIASVLPVGQKPNVMTVEMRAAEIAMREWPKAWRGEETTASALDSGAPVSIGSRPQAELLLIGVNKAARKLTSGLSFRELRLSPDSAHIATLRQVNMVRPDPNKPLIQGRTSGIFEVVAFGREGQQVLPGLADVKEVRSGSLRWSPDGKSLALIGRLDSVNAQVVSCTVGTAMCQTFPTGDPAAVMWSGNNILHGLLSPKAGSRQDWWALNSPGQPRNITAAMKSVPRELFRKLPPDSFVGVADGELWRIYVDGREPLNLTAKFEPRIISTAWPTSSTDDPKDLRQVMVSVRKGTATEWQHVDLQSSQISLLPKPNSEATLAAFYPRDGAAVLTARDRSGTFMWLAHAPFTNPTVVVKTNTQLREIAQTEFTKVEYRTSDGRDLKGWVLLPVGHEKGKKYPLITVVYAGQMFSDNPPGGMIRSINNPSALNYHLLAAHGYAVLFPSIPLKPEGEASDPYLELTKGVMPAVDKVIEMGIADPKRLGLMGQSYGGYATYGLIAQTNRFQAAVSLAGLSDLVSLYGVFDARFRYDQFAHERLSGMSQAETGQIRMGNPPWKDFERYTRNSPLTYVDRIETPLMIVHGDLDYVAMQQGEQLFSALHRQNKRATFVRYWGEGHVLESPANIRDLWQRIISWFDSLLRS